MTDYSHLEQFASKVRIPSPHESISKEEAAFSFATPESEDGLYISLSSFIAYDRKYALADFNKNKQPLYLHYKKIAKPKPVQEIEEPPKKKPTILAIGVEGGFEDHKVEYDEFWTLVELPEFKEYPITTQLPERIYQSILGIQQAKEASRQQDSAAFVATEERPVSRFAKDLLQLDNGVKIPPSGWQCQECDKRDNLWLNLTDGSILCGRAYVDGSGGNNHAVEYYAKTQYPLVVKLGTITPEGADVFSYPEDSMVEDPYLKSHLAHFGINIDEMKQTEKTMAELTLDYNYSFDWSKIQESGKVLSPLYGPGYTGLKNLGNSCYLNSVVQTIFALPELQHKFFNEADKFFEEALSQGHPSQHFGAQMAKLAMGIYSGDYSLPAEDGSTKGIAPRTFKHLIGKGHREFATMNQQDALEFYQHLLTLIERDAKSKGSQDLSKLFKFTVEEKIKCTSSGKVKLTQHEDNVLWLAIPIEAAVNRTEVEEANKNLKPGEPKKKYIVPFSECLNTVAAPEDIQNFYSSAIQGKTTAIKRTGIKTFPKYLLIAMRRFVRGENWATLKLDASVSVPDFIDLSPLQSTGLEPGEELLPETVTGGSSGIEASNAIVSSLMDFGFPEGKCKKAAIATKNAGVEQATEWLLEHMDDPDEPEVIPPTSNVSEEHVAMLISMGFSQAQAIKALKATDNNIERATDWIFSHADEPDVPETGSTKAEENIAPGSAKYELVSIISHIGGSVHSGHYVCHIKKGDRWVFFNDEKVVASEEPPRDMGYLYLFKQV